MHSNTFFFWKTGQHPKGIGLSIFYIEPKGLYYKSVLFVFKILFENREFLTPNNFMSNLLIKLLLYYFNSLQSYKIVSRSKVPHLI
jgi:hypothetical protein